MELLKTGYYSIEEIANLSGFYDPKYFSSLYKQKFGVLPSAKRKKAFSTDHKPKNTNKGYAPIYQKK